MSKARNNKVKLNNLFFPFEFGAVGNGVDDDTTALTNLWAAVTAGGTIDLDGKTYRVVTDLGRPANNIVVRNGTIYLDNSASNLSACVVASDDCVFDNVKFIGNAVTGTGATAKYQIGIASGNTTWPGSLGVAPAQRVMIRNCTFEDLTVGVWAGGASIDTPPDGWQIIGSTFTNIVGYENQSEGYGVGLFGASDALVQGNWFNDVERHCIYMSAGASQNYIDGNNVYGCSNTPIVIYASPTQGDCVGNRVTNNVLANLTLPSVVVGRPSVGIGLYSRSVDTLVSGNIIRYPKNTGIDCVGTYGATAYNSGNKISGNIILMDATADWAGIYVSDAGPIDVSDNLVVVNSAIAALKVESDYDVTPLAYSVCNNTLKTTDSDAIALVVDLDTGITLQAYRNDLKGFQLSDAYRLTNTSGAGSVRTDIVLGDYADDAAAAAGGVELYQPYRNGSALMIRVS